MASPSATDARNVTAPTDTQIQQALALVERAVQQKQLTASASDNLRRWLAEPRYAEYRAAVVADVSAGRWRELDDAFWTVIPFGTGGRRGRMYPIGSNAINDRTIGESAQGLADYIVAQFPGKSARSCAIAYDTRHNSRRFAELCAGVMVAAGFRVYFLDDYRATPQLSFAVRHFGCDCGIMVTASHNPPSDNAVKVYWSTGGQILPPHDRAIIDRVMRVDLVRQTPFQQAVNAGDVVLCTAELDQAFTEVVSRQSTPGPRGLRILYTPLHGVGAAAVLPVLAAAGFADVAVYAPHQMPDGDFPNVPGHVSNPENPAVFDGPIAQAQQQDFDLVLATDPDCDRLGVAIPMTGSNAGPWTTLTGNQIGALLCDYVLSQAKAHGGLTSRDYVVKTLVTTELITRIAESYGVRCVGDLLVGFKWIAGTMDAEGPDGFRFGAEESHGYLVGQYARDKDAAVACLLMSELAAELKHRGSSVIEQLRGLYRRHGLFAERLLNIQMEGSEGMGRMQRLMEQLRVAPPRELGGMPVALVRDYEKQQARAPGGSPQPLSGPRGDMVFLDLAPGNSVAVRPSGTEPKVKCYLFACLPPTDLDSLEAGETALRARLDRMAADAKAYVAGIA
jgi:phosphoglucomutase/phosphomannomutase